MTHDPLKALERLERVFAVYDVPTVSEVIALIRAELLETPTLRERLAAAEQALECVRNECGAARQEIRATVLILNGTPVDGMPTTRLTTYARQAMSDARQAYEQRDEALATLSADRACIAQTIAGRLAKAYDAGVEDAAKVCEALDTTGSDACLQGDGYQQGALDGAEECASRIRALASKERG